MESHSARRHTISFRAGILEEGFIKIVFVRSEADISDEFTKNVTGDIYDAHASEYMTERSALVDGETLSYSQDEGC
jgi:hypothetical protein